MSASVGVALHGARGRMGRELLALMKQSSGLRLEAALDRADAEEQGEEVQRFAPGAPGGVCLTADLEAACQRADVVMDFSAPSALAELAGVCARLGKPLVTGTTGLDAAAERAVAELAERAAVVAAPNFSQGVTLLFHLAELASRRLGPDFDAEIVEAHHRRKVDAPSGTAARLAEIVTRAKAMDARDAVVFGRQGQVGARPDAEVGVLSVRGGDIVGEHTLFLIGQGERLELTHRATDRAIFARGALRAARWVVGRAPGRYDMKDVMGLSTAD